MKIETRIISVFLCMIMVFVIVPVKASALESSADEFTDYYGRSALAKLDNSSALLYAYDRIAEGVEICAESINVYNGKDNLSWDELMVVMDAYHGDYAHHFWMGNAYSTSGNAETVTTVFPSYYMTGTELETAKAEFEKKVEEILSGIKDSMSEYEKELYLHDKIAGMVEYVSGTNAHTAYGALVEGKAVCDGYSKALQHLLHRVGIQSYIVTGISLNPCSGQPEGHAWNLVRIDGEYYHTDLTWDDQGEYLFHMYFNQNDEVISEGHTIDEIGYELPKCNSAAAQYFTGKQEYLSSYTVDSVAKILKDNAFRASVYIPGSASDFMTWYSSNIRSIAAKAGVTGGFSYGYVQLGREIILIINFDCTHKNLEFVSAKAETCTEDGSIAYYKCFCGKWFEDKNAKNEITDRSSVIIPAPGHDYSEKIKDAVHIRTEAADCTEYGTYWYDCSRCAANAKDDSQAEDKYYSGTEKGGHKYESTVTAPTCEEQGYTVHACSVCGESYTDSYTDAVGHSFSEWSVVTEATCTENGEERRDCGSCGHYETRVIEAKGHDFSEWYETKAPTEEEDGEERRDCKTCGHYETRIKTLAPPIKYGDVNGDGVVNVFDANLVCRAAIGLIELTESQKAAADVDGSGVINVFDANYICRYAIGLIIKFPAER